MSVYLYKPLYPQGDLPFAPLMELGLPTGKIHLVNCSTNPGDEQDQDPSPDGQDDNDDGSPYDC